MAALLLKADPALAASVALLFCVAIRTSLPARLLRFAPN
jgi:hypothetical protein